MGLTHFEIAGLAGVITLTACVVDHQIDNDSTSATTRGDDPSTEGDAPTTGEPMTTGLPGSVSDTDSPDPTSGGLATDTDATETGVGDTGVTGGDTDGAFDPVIGQCIPETCPPLSLDCDYDGCGEDSVGVVDCAMQAFASSWDGTPAYLRIDENLGDLYHYGMLAVGDGTVLVESSGFSEGEALTTRHCQLEAQADLLACTGSIEDDCYGTESFYVSSTCVDVEPICPE